MNKYQYSTKTIFYQKARFFRKSGTNEAAYCIEPFAFFNQNIQYESTLNPYNLDQSQKDRISKIAYYGYGYKNHTTPDWYAITQFMIWQVADNGGDYYFTNGLNGPRINLFQDKINEINNLVNLSNIKPSFTNEEFTIVENQQIIIEDKNNQISNYKTNDSNININDNKLIINNLKEGEYIFTFNKNNELHNTPQIFYQADGTQNLIKLGDIQNDSISIKIKSIKTELEVNKLDNDNESIIPQGEAELDGAKYKITDENNNFVNEIEIKNNNCIIENLPFNTYYIQEIEAGKGYNIDEKIYEFEITKENPKVKLYLKNKVIESTITIHKTYDDNLNESNITFNIYNKNNELIRDITTDGQGIAQVTLPYGTYNIKQVNSTEGYYKSDDITINIDKNDNINLEIYDKKIEIEVPNTSTNIYRKIIVKILGILLLIW